MTMPAQNQPIDLTALRREIDRIDAAMHGLLMERGEIIDRLIAVKRTQETGSAFRPAREADMMRRLVERHRGMLPLDTVESIWRVIIATFTYVQAPYSVHADLAGGDATMRDSARFHFGFTAPLVTHMGARAVVAAVVRCPGDLGLVSALAGGDAWWSELEGDAAPKIIARLPFVERPDHPAALPVFALSYPATDAVAAEVALWSIRASGWNAAIAGALAPVADVMAAPDGAVDDAALLVSVPAGRTLEDVTSALMAAGTAIRACALVGGHATRYRVEHDGERPAPIRR
jgi:chorismate mutase